MPINFVTGLPRTGKTLWTLCQVRALAEKEKRQVYTCNIPGITIPGWLEIDHPDKWMDCPDGAIIIVDELQDFWQKQPPGAKVPLPILDLSKHGKRGIDFYFITQEPDLVHSTPRSLCAHHYFIVRAFGSQNVMVYKFERMQLHPDKIKTKGEKFPWRYNKAAFGWYKSADTHNIKRKIPLKVWMIPITALIAAGSIYGGIKLFNGVVNGVKDGGAIPGQSSALSSLPGGPSGNPAVRGSVAVRPVLTGAQYAASFQPRIEGFPQTAPRYDDVEKVTQAPKPAACIDGIKPGAKVRSCACWTQQATPVNVPVDLCRQLAAGGFFDDTLPPDVPRSAPPPAVGPVATAGNGQIVVADSSGYGLRSSDYLQARNVATKSIIKPDALKPVQ